VDVLQVKGIVAMGGLMEWWRLYENVSLRFDPSSQAAGNEASCENIAGRLYTSHPSVTSRRHNL
jgi:hypothetical protein